MASVQVATRAGGRADIAEDVIADLRGRLRGSLLTADDPGYDEARAVWNGMIDKRPGLIVRCAGAADVLSAIRFARTRCCLVSIKGAGHNIAGSAVCDGGLMLDLSPMKSVHVDPWNRTARVEPGATLADLDRESQAFGLATPLGINSTTGVAGLTLGGGFGWLSRSFGHAIDNLVSADVGTANGELLRASPDENADLFWGIRGGGGNLGVVTSFTFRLHPVGPEVLAGLVVYPFDRADQYLRQYRAFVAEAPDALTVWTVLRKAPPLPFLPADVHGKEVVVFALLYAGDAEEGQRAIEPIRHFGTPVGEHVGPMPFAAWQSAFDPLLTPGARNYWKSHDFAQLSDAALDLMVEYAGNLPTPECEIFIAHLDGAAGRVAADAMAYPHRDARFVLNVHTRWRDPGDDQACIAWARSFFAATAPHATGGVYVNFLTADEQDRVHAAYGDNYDRLAALKAKYDPDNLFQVNFNVRPAA
ncbi:MAG: FAD-binding oxidoreductase [Rhodospirillales bacterium]